MSTQKLKYKCEEGLEIYSRVKNTRYHNYIEIKSDAYELPRLIKKNHSQKLIDLYEEIKYLYGDTILYENDQWICQEYRELAEEYVDVDTDNDEIIVKIILTYRFKIVY